jgi:hypothetical protein
MGGIPARAHLGEWAKLADGQEGRVVGYLEQPSYSLELLDGSKVDVAASCVESFTPPPLPTVPGFYVGEHHSSPGGRMVVELLNSPREWVDCVDGRYLDEWAVGGIRNLHRLVEAIPGSTVPGNEKPILVANHLETGIWTDHNGREWVPVNPEVVHS